MEFLKKHYEKILLSLVLLGLAGASFFLIIQVGNIRSELREKEEMLGQASTAPIQSVLRDYQTYEKALAQATNPPQVKLTGAHLAFNPTRWVTRPDGQLVKVPVGEEAVTLVLTKTTPLHLVVSYLGATGRADKPRYQIGVTREAEKARADRVMKRLFGGPGDKLASLPFGDSTLTLIIKEVKGENPLDPADIVLQIEETKETITISKDNPYKTVTDRSADLHYPPENRAFPNRRVGDTLDLAGKTYNIVAISANQVVLSAPNGKRIQIELSQAP